MEAPGARSQAAPDRHQTVRPLAIEKAAMSAPGSSARISFPAKPRVSRSFSSSVIASPALAELPRPAVHPVSRPACGAGSPNQTVLPRRPVLTSRARER
jgi:hypothetical protein